MTFSTSGNFLPETIDLPEQQKDLPPFLKTRLEEIIRLLNRKDTGTYDLSELQNNQQFYGANPQVKRFVFRKVFQFTGALLTFPHNITGAAMYTRIYGTVQTAADSRPLPYVDTVAVTNQVSVLVTGANIVITNGATAPAIVSGLVVVEYLKN